MEKVVYIKIRQYTKERQHHYFLVTLPYEVYETLNLS